jgi:hypothetical protein
MMLKAIAIPPRGALLATAVLAATCALAACGSSSNQSASRSSSTTRSGTSSRSSLFACLRQHGVTLPNRGAGAGPPGGAPGGGGAAPGDGAPGAGGAPPAGGGGFPGGGAGGIANNPKLRAAFQACGGRNFRFPGAPGRFRLARTAIDKYVACVRKHGYNLPSPNFSGKGPIFPAKIRGNAKFQAASRACQSLLVPARPTGTATTSGA